MQLFNTQPMPLQPMTSEMESLVDRAVESFFDGLDDLLAEEDLPGPPTLSFAKEVDPLQWLTAESQWMN